MPADPFTNATPYYDAVFPSSGDSFSIFGFKNALQAIAFGDMIMGQPRAHTPPDMSVMVRGRDNSSYFNNVYFGTPDQRIPMPSGDTPFMPAPLSNPRIDIVYRNASGDVRVVRGTEAASPTLPSTAPSGSTILPICAIFHRVGETAIVNFWDKDSRSGDGYIYQDLRPFFHVPVT